MSFDLSDYEVGDEFETSPHELGRVISAILAEEGTFLYEGNSITITSLPKRKPVAKTPELVVEEVIVKAPEPVKEEPVKEEPKPVEEPVKEAPKSVEKEAVKETPKPVEKEAVKEEPKPVIKSTYTPKPTGRPNKTA